VKYFVTIGAQTIEVDVDGDRVLVGVLFADDAGKEMLEGLGQGGDDATDDVDVRPTKIDI